MPMLIGDSARSRLVGEIDRRDTEVGEAADDVSADRWGVFMPFRIGVKIGDALTTGEADEGRQSEA